MKNRVSAVAFLAWVVLHMRKLSPPSKRAMGLPAREEVLGQVSPHLGQDGAGLGELLDGHPPRCEPGPEGSLRRRRCHALLSPSWLRTLPHFLDFQR